MSLAQRTAHIGLARLRLLLRRAGARPKLFFGIAGLLGILAVVLGYSGLAYASLRQAGQDARAMQDELLGVTPLALTRPDTFSELADMALRLEQSAVAARRWLTALRALTWFPILGGKARERMELLDLAASGAGVTRKVSHAYSRAFVIPPEATSSEAIVDAIGRSLKSDAASFADAQRELTRIGEVIDGLGETALGARAREQLGRYLPYLEAVVHLSRVAPEVVGDAYVLYRTLDSLRDLTDNPLKVMETPSAVRDSLRAADRESVALSARLDLVLLAAQGNGPSEERLSRRALDVLRLTQQQVQVLNRATRGLDAMVAVTELGDEEGFLTPRFGGRARGELERASREFTLARQELAALQALLNTQDVTAQETFASLLGAGLGASSSSPDFMAGLLEDADLFSQFLYTFLGYSGPRTYLLLGQNENEPRGSGGFLGVVAQATVSDGVLAPLKYYDSGNLNQQPASLNPPSPPGYYWYFYMSHMLFQDANWYPHFPATAELLAEMFRRKTGVQADGVLTANKRLTLDLVELFGDIRVPGHDGPLDRAKANEYQETEDLYACRPGRSIDRGKRCFDEDLFFAFV
ncbi:MAG: DUF4012 domain-containing protein, partial [SAR202 cluster bacterium]|nr:DUF4012 domain-containing protein [SAR202 cluster bacterium]